MALEAIFFYIPAMFWGQMSPKSGLNVINLVKSAQEAENEEVSSIESQNTLWPGGKTTRKSASNSETH